jgi:hypothetical protein
LNQLTIYFAASVVFAEGIDPAQNDDSVSPLVARPSIDQCISGSNRFNAVAPSFHLRIVLSANGNGRCADRAFEGPATNVIDLFLHRLR